MITEDYVSFEIAKLLKEKGFDELCPTFYEIDKPNSGPRYSEKLGWFLHNSYNYSDRHGKMIISAPTLQMAMKWLRVQHNLHIAVIVAYHHLPRKYEAHIMKLENIDDFILHQQVDFDSYEEACEAAIRYCLENLI